MTPQSGVSLDPWTPFPSSKLNLVTVPSRILQKFPVVVSVCEEALSHHLLKSGMSVLEHQARSFFLRCRASRVWTSRCAATRTRVQALSGSRRISSVTDAVRQTFVESSKPFYVTTPIYYVNACMRPSFHNTANTHSPQLLTLATYILLS